MNNFGYSSPVGPLEITVDEVGAVTRIHFGDGEQTPLPEDHALRKALDAYFEGRGGLESVEVSMQLSDFQRAVLTAAREIPPGEVRTYAWIAQKIGRPAAARAVGNALGANPIALVIPCHRVVAGSGLGGFAGGLDKKEKLLAHESRWANV